MGGPWGGEGTVFGVRRWVLGVIMRRKWGLRGGPEKETSYGGVWAGLGANRWVLGVLWGEKRPWGGSQSIWGVPMGWGQTL